MAARQEVTFEHFTDKVGLLSGVWFHDEKRLPYYEGDESNEIANCCYFMWQGEIYRAQENPDDGYRSSLGTLELLRGVMPANVWDPSERCRVTYMREQPRGDWEGAGMERCDIIQFVSCVTDKVVLTIGTTNTDDYYPGCVLHFDPRNLSHNQPEIDLLGRALAN